MNNPVRLSLPALVAVGLCASTAAAQTGFEWPPQMQVEPACIHPESLVVITLDGVWHDSGPPNSAQISRSGQVIDIEVEAPGSVLPVISVTPWSLQIDAGRLPAGEYDVYATAFHTHSMGHPARPRTLVGTIIVDAGCPAPCYANCDGSVTEPILTVDDFTCFINEFAAAQSLPHEEQVSHYANCDGSTTAPALTVDDFTCFINAFAAGCP